MRCGRFAQCNVDEVLVDLVHLRERFAGSEEVSGSIPLRSAIHDKRTQSLGAAFFVLAGLKLMESNGGVPARREY